jgi:D-glycero-D-manno-heptose 1,7-bisphosphate phosphatase
MGVRTVAPAFQRRAVFLDRDGVLNRPIVRNGRPYPPATEDEFEILPDALEALSALRQHGFWLCVVTNQPDVARGTQRRTVVESMNALLRKALPIDDIYSCYHDDADSCGCRKPKPGLLLTAAAEHNIAATGNYMIGDRWRDIDCGHAANCTTIFIDRGYNESLRKQPHFKASDLVTAAGIISFLEGGL